MTESASIQRVKCSGCQAGFKIQAAMVGRQVKCPKCQTVFKAIPEGQSPAVEPAFGEESFEEQVRCGYCKKNVPRSGFLAHRRRHMGDVNDAQSDSFPSLPPENRWKGDLSTVPGFYTHAACGKTTGMPEAVIRTYLVDPYFYAYKSYCSGCNRQVRNTELTWNETGEGMMDYMRGLQARHPRGKELRRNFLRGLVISSLVISGILATLLSFGTYLILGGTVSRIAFFATIVLGPPAVGFTLLKLRGGV